MGCLKLRLLLCASAVFTTSQALPMLIATVALSIAPIVIEARKNLDPTEDEFDPVRIADNCWVHMTL